jgi:hypothetical protein
VTKKVYTTPETEQGDRLYDLSALTKIAPMFQIEDCCYVVLEKMVKKFDAFSALIPPRYFRV